MTGRAERLYGKFRGMVVDNLDPMQQGRLRIQVPDVFGPQTAMWAIPCLPVGGLTQALFAVPIVGSSVWVEFEQGNPDYPLWVGCFWESPAESLRSGESPGSSRLNVLEGELTQLDSSPAATKKEQAHIPSAARHHPGADGGAFQGA